MTQEKINIDIEKITAQGEKFLEKMKKSYVYKYALSAVIEKLSNERETSGLTADQMYELVSCLCEKIDIELLNERREAGGAGLDETAAQSV